MYEYFPVLFSIFSYLLELIIGQPKREYFKSGIIGAICVIPIFFMVLR